MSKLQPLTAEEQRMAEQYLYLVDAFLRRKHLDSSEYYDVAIFGLLKAIQWEYRNRNPPKDKNIFGLIEVCMRQEVINEWRYQGREMRRGDRESFSLDYISANTDAGGFSLYDVVADPRQKTVVQVEAKDLVSRVLAVATPREREAIDLLCFGYETSEIAENLGIAHSTVCRILYAPTAQLALLHHRATGV